MVYDKRSILCCIIEQICRCLQTVLCPDVTKKDTCYRNRLSINTLGTVCKKHFYDFFLSLISFVLVILQFNTVLFAALKSIKLMCCYFSGGKNEVKP